MKRINIRDQLDYISTKTLDKPREQLTTNQVIDSVCKSHELQQELVKYMASKKLRVIKESLPTSLTRNGGKQSMGKITTELIKRNKK